MVGSHFEKMTLKITLKTRVKLREQWICVTLKIFCGTIRAFLNTIGDVFQCNKRGNVGAIIFCKAFLCSFSDISEWLNFSV